MLLALFAAGTYLWKDMAVKRAKAEVAERAAAAIGEQARNVGVKEMLGNAGVREMLVSGLHIDKRGGPRDKSVKV